MACWGYQPPPPPPPPPPPEKPPPLDPPEKLLPPDELQDEPLEDGGGVVANEFPVKLEEKVLIAKMDCVPSYHEGVSVDS